MITLSSKRILKRPELTGGVSVETYLPPLEQLLAGREIVPQKPVFPRYTREDLLREKGGIPDPEPEAPPEEETAAAEEADGQEEEPAAQWEAEAERLLEEAREEAARIIKEAEAEAEQRKQEAFEEGRKEGYAAGYEDGKEQADRELRGALEGHLLKFQADVKKALQSVEQAKERCVHTYLEELKDCAVAVGEKVIHISLRSSGEVIKQMIIAATEKLKKTAWVKIYIDKYDYDMMMKADAGVIEELSHLSDNIKFIVMDKEERGSCIVEMPEEIVDVSVNTQIENIREILENVRI